MVLRLAALLLVATPLVAADGVVRLSRAEYDKLKDAADAAALAPARRKTPEAPPSLESATYELRVEGERIVLDLTLDVSVKAPASDARLTLVGPGLLDSLFDKGPGTVAAFVDPSTRKATLLFRKEGRYRVSARYLPAERREGDRRVVDFTALPAASARLVVASLAPGLELVASTGGAPGEPLVAGAARPVPSSAFVRITVKNPARVPTAADRPVLLAEVVDVVRPEREHVYVRTAIKAAVSRAELRELVLAVPPGSELVSVTGPEEPLAESDRARGLVTLKLARPLLGEATFSALFIRPAPAEGQPIELVPTRLPDATSTKGFLLIAPTPLREQTPVSIDGLGRTDVADLPPLARPFASGGTRAYRVVDASLARLVLKAPLRQVVAPPDTLLHEASLLTVFGDGASRVDRRRFVLETKRPYFSVPLEADEEVLSVSVDQAPVKPQTDAGALVVLLPPTRVPRRLVDVTTKRKGSVPPKSGEMTIAHAPLPGVASLATWTIVVPEDRRYRVISTAGIRKAGWSEDTPAETKTFQVSASSWMGAGGRLEQNRVAGKKEDAQEKAGGDLEDRKSKDRDDRSRRQAAKVPATIAPSAVPEVASEEEAVGEGDLGTVAANEPMAVADTLTQAQNRAGVRSLPMDVTGHGKRLTLSGPLVGGEPLSVTLRVKGK